MDQQSAVTQVTTEPRWHEMPLAEVQTALASRNAEGLSHQEALRRLEQAGPNRLKPEKHRSLLEEIWETVREPMQLLLLATGVLYAVFGDLEETLTIFVVILFVIATEVVNETRAERAMAALSTLAELTAIVRRAGQTEEIPAETVVAGDVLLLQVGRWVPADGRLLEAASLSLDESALTGESLPVEKRPQERLPAETPLAEQHNLIFAETSVVRGQGTALVVATGMQSTIGRIARLTREVQAPRTPLQVAVLPLSVVDNSAFSPHCLTILSILLILPYKLPILLISCCEDPDDPVCVLVPALVLSHSLPDATEEYERLTWTMQGNGSRMRENCSRRRGEESHGSSKESWWERRAGDESTPYVWRSPGASSIAVELGHGATHRGPQLLDCHDASRWSSP